MKGLVYGGPRAGLLLIGAGLVVAASPWARRRSVTWGSEPEEATATLPGDELLPDAGLVSTRAITIDAEPSAVWPWLVQMGSGRGGAYTYDWIENLFGLNMHTTDEILPQFQHLAVGDTLPLGSQGPAMRVEICDRDRTLAFRSGDGAWVWIFELRPDRGVTRLISRNRISPPGGSRAARWAYDVVMAPGSLIMERRMLRGIKKRAERIVGLSPKGRSALPLAGRALSSPPVVALSGTTIASAARLMDTENVKRLPVIDDLGRLIGIVSRGDLLKVHLRPDDEIRTGVRRDVFDVLLPERSDRVDVAVGAGVVTLTGPIDRRSTANLVVRLSRQVPGVVGVVDRLDVAFQDTDTTGAGVFLVA